MKVGIIGHMRSKFTRRLTTALLGIVSLLAFAGADKVATGEEISYFRIRKDGQYERIKTPPDNLKCRSRCLVYDKDEWRCPDTMEAAALLLGEPQKLPALCDDNTAQNMVIQRQ
jgi:hypothetical protein